MARSHRDARSGRSDKTLPARPLARTSICASKCWETAQALVTAPAAGVRGRMYKRVDESMPAVHPAVQPEQQSEPPVAVLAPRKADVFSLPTTPWQLPDMERARCLWRSGDGRAGDGREGSGAWVGGVASTIPPSRPQAKREAGQRTFGDGEGNIIKTPVERFEVVSYGLVMYFELLKRLFLCFLAMSIISLPSLYLCARGHSLEENGLADNLSRYSIANLGAVCRLSVRATLPRAHAHAPGSMMPLAPDV